MNVKSVFRISVGSEGRADNTPKLAAGSSKLLLKASRLACGHNVREKGFVSGDRDRQNYKKRDHSGDFHSISK